MRNSYADSFALVRKALTLAGEPRPVVDRPPRLGDPYDGPALVDGVIEGDEFWDLTLPGLLIRNAGLIYVSFGNCDLHSTTFEKSGFTGCDFSRCDLSGSIFRESQFEGCSFREADLRNADLRRSRFSSDCDFTDCRLGDAKMDVPSRQLWFRGSRLRLSDEQRAAIIWFDAAT